MNIATYVLNRPPSKKLAGKTPHEIWYGHKPSISHLRVFGSPAYALVPAAKGHKLDARSEKLIFVGYMDSLKAYKLLEPLTHTTTYARSVIIHEAALLDSPAQTSMPKRS